MQSRVGRDETLETQLMATGGRSSGFDYMRITLAVAILCFHSCITSYGSAADVVFWNTPLKPFARLLLPMFFALSGFLVAGSLERCRTLISFLGLRVIRIYPALIVESVLSAFVLGPFVTTYALSDYFRDWRFAAYLLNTIGDIHYQLPGVFASNPEPDIVNGQLWTVPYELSCYIVLAALTLLGVKRRRIVAPVAAVLVVVVFVVARFVKYHGAFPQFATALPGPLLLASFLTGVSLYLYRQRVPFESRLFFASALLSIALLGIIPHGEYLAPVAVAYATVYLGLLDPKKIALIKSADYSYGIFLYSFSIQQAVSAAMPWTRHWTINILICLPLSAAVAAFSWHVVEKPAMRLRKSIARLEDAFLELGSLGSLAARKLPFGSAVARQRDTTSR
jgi:peptidoglycan/LPS O-acetylase OafA/YrhL